MTKALIFSDSHKQFLPMMKAIEKEGRVDYIIHAGDVHSDVEDLMALYPKTPVISVKGNNDFWLPDVPDERFFQLEKVKIFLTHGHMFGVKYSLAGLYKKADSLGADICIFGHTHISHNENLGNITLFNPGTASAGYGVLEINDTDFNIKVLKGGDLK